MATISQQYCTQLHSSIALWSMGNISGWDHDVPVVNIITDRRVMNQQKRKKIEGTVDPNKDDLVVWYASITDVPDLKNNSTAYDVMHTLTTTERAKVEKFLFPADQKRSFLSVLLQRAMIRNHFSIQDTDYEIRRTAEGKPYLKVCSDNTRDAVADAGHWNYNVSHHGDFVCIAAHSNLLVGTDIVDLETRSSMASSAMEFVEIFSRQLTPTELNSIRSLRYDSDKYRMFFVYWSLKEAFIKAVGQGLGYDLQTVEFTLHSENLVSAGKKHSGPAPNSATYAPTGTATVSISGTPRPDWRFDFTGLDKRHVMSVARGPLSEALLSYQEAAGWKLSASRRTYEATEAMKFHNEMEETHSISTESGDPSGLTTKNSATTPALAVDTPTERIQNNLVGPDQSKQELKQTFGVVCLPLPQAERKTPADLLLL